MGEYTHTYTGDVSRYGVTLEGRAGAARIVRIVCTLEGEGTIPAGATVRVPAARVERAHGTVTVSAVEPVPASGPGALDGYAFTCTCRGGTGSSLPGMAESARREHIAWHETRGERVELEPARMHRAFGIAAPAPVIVAVEL